MDSIREETSNRMDINHAWPSDLGQQIQRNRACNLTQQDITKLHKYGHTVNTVIIYNVMDMIRQFHISIQDREVAQVRFPKIGLIIVWRVHRCRRYGYSMVIQELSCRTSILNYPLVNQHSYGKELCSMGQLTISMAMFNSYVSHYQRCINRIQILSIDYPYTNHQLTIY